MMKKTNNNNNNNGNVLNHNEIKSLIKDKLPILVDFDSTMIITDKFPNIIGENKPCVDIMKKWIDGGVGIILWTIRDGKTLDEAVSWCKSQGLELYGINENPTQSEWNGARKIYGVLRIDDANVGTKLIYDDKYRPRVDWEYIDKNYTKEILECARPFID